MTSAEAARRQYLMDLHNRGLIGKNTLLRLL